MTDYEVVWIYAQKPDSPKTYKTKADDGFEAEKDFLTWAGSYLIWPVKVLRVQSKDEK